MNQSGQAKTLFVPGWIDDSGLTPVQFRILAHVSRRGECCSSADTIAKICRVNRKSVFSALKDLESGGWIERESRFGSTTIIRSTTPQTLQKLGSELGQVEDNPGIQTGQGAGSELGQVGKQVVSETEQGAVAETERHPSQIEPHKGSPSKVLPFKEEEDAPSAQSIKREQRGRNAC